MATINQETIIKTQKVYDAIKSIRDIDAYVLVGGTAMSLQSQHRYSMDLDFATTSINLDQRAINNIINQLKASGHAVEFATDPIKIQEADNEGITLKDYQQDWLIDGVKVTFFSIGDNPVERDRLASQTFKKDQNVRIMGIDGLFVTKCIALMNRIKSRDLYDLLWMIQHDNKSIVEVFNTIQDLRPHINYETIRFRLLDWPIPITDEGIDAKEPMSAEDVRTLLRVEVDRMEESLASAMINEVRSRKPSIK